MPGVPTCCVTDAELSDFLKAAVAAQATLCRWPKPAECIPFADTYQVGLRRAIFRHVARDVAAKGLPLGSSTLTFGPG